MSLPGWPVKSIPLDDNGMPEHYHVAEASATVLLQEMWNEMPHSDHCHLSYEDAKWVTSNLCMRFLGMLEDKGAGRHGSVR
jgi:hypothetical protein